MARTPLYAEHLALKGHVVDFHGWDLPLYYADIRSEHLAVRQKAGLFDLSHMGRLRLSGPGAQELLERLCTQEVGSMPVGRCRYGIVLDERGCALDDILVYREAKTWFLVVNASNRPKILAWIAKHKPASVDVEDLTEALALIAVQGPKAVDLVQPLAGADIASLKYYTFCEARPNGVPGLISRTGYTGEDGFEIYLPASAAPACWKALSKAVPIGLGARDTLRLEAGMPLYGHELDEETSPLEAGLDWAVKFTKDFIGRAALEKAKASGLKKRLVGLEVADKRIPRQGYPVLKGGKPVGTVTSGTLSPLTGKTIAMAYVYPAEAAVGNALEVEVRGTGYPAKVAALPFYRREKNVKA